MYKKLRAGLWPMLLGSLLGGCFPINSDEDFWELQDPAAKAAATGSGGSNGSGGSGSGSGGSSSACPVGKWTSPTCSGLKKVIFTLNSDGTGSFANPDCNGLCTDLVFYFRYTLSGGRINYSYTKTDNVTCSGTNQGAPSVPTGSYSITYTCNSDGTLTSQTVGSQTVTTYTRY